MSRPSSLDQFVADDLHHLLGRRQRGHDLLAHRLLADVVDQVLDDLEVDVGLQQRQADLAQRLVDVLLGQLALPAEILERALQLFGKVLKHNGYSRL